MADPKTPAKSAEPPAGDPPAEDPGTVDPRDDAKALMKEAFSEWLDENKPASDDRNKPSTGADLFKKILGF
jgi:hypothetical protein